MANLHKSRIQFRSEDFALQGVDTKGVCEQISGIIEPRPHPPKSVHEAVGQRTFLSGAFLSDFKRFQDPKQVRKEPSCWHTSLFTP